MFNFMQTVAPCVRPINGLIKFKNTDSNCLL